MNEQNLTPFTTGDKRASIAGRKSKRRGLEQQLQKFLESKYKKGDKTTRLELLYEALFRHGMKGNTTAVNIMLERAYGKVRDVKPPDLPPTGQPEKSNDILPLETTEQIFKIIESKNEHP